MTPANREDFLSLRGVLARRYGLETGVVEGPTPVHYLRRRGRGPALLCLHGLGDSGLTYPEFVATEALSECEVVIPDIPGFGVSPRREEATRTLQGQAEVALALLDACGDDRFLVVGHSMGGAVAIHLAEMAPERCLGILNLEGNLTFSDCTLSAEASGANTRGRYPEWRKDVVPRLVKMGEAGEEGVVRFMKSFVVADPESYLEASHALVEESSGSGLGKRYLALDVPRLYIHGKNSSPPETLEFVRNYGLDESYHAAAGHWPHWDAREDVAEVCAGFLERLPG